MRNHSTISRELASEGYLDWLHTEIKKLAQAKFATARPEDADALRRAREMLDLAAEVRQIILSSANDRQNRT